MATSTPRPTFADPELQREIMRLRQVDHWTNLGYLAFEYGCLALVIGLTVGFAEYRLGWGLSWWWNVPVFAVAIVLVGGLQHRLAGLGHESSHYSFMRNRVLNDLIPDLFCMFPLFTTIHFYRLFHMGHHQFTNDPERDPDLLNLGEEKRANEFPMTRARFIAVVYFCMFVAPYRFLRYQWAYFQVNTLGQGRSVYRAEVGGDSGPWPRLGTALGIGYLFSMSALFRVLTGAGMADWMLPAALTGIALAVAVVWHMPGRFLFQSPFRQACSVRLTSAIRLGYYTLVLLALAQIRWYTEGRSVAYVILLWLVPLGSSFMFFMFLRDVYQHSNADAGRLTNSRVFFADPFTRWAVFVYGQDMHIPHHLFPAVPHYRLRALHQILKNRHSAYRGDVVETHGTFWDAQGRPTILDEMTRPAHEHA